MAPGMLRYVGKREVSGQHKQLQARRRTQVKTEVGDDDYPPGMLHDLEQMKQEITPQADHEDAESAQGYVPADPLRRRLDAWKAPPSTVDGSYPSTTSGRQSPVTSTAAARIGVTKLGLASHVYTAAPTHNETIRPEDSTGPVVFASQHQKALVRDRLYREAVPLPTRHSQQAQHSLQTQYPGVRGQASPRSGYRDVQAERHAHHDDYMPVQSTAHGLDYDNDELYRMTFAELQAQPFDYDPVAGPTSVVEGEQEGLSLEERLELVRKTSGDRQSAFIASLSTADWEAAGQWFTKQFAALNARSVQCRRERRALLHEHEKTIANHFAVIKDEDEQLQCTIKDMQAKGRAFVTAATTPKRKR